MRTLGQKPNVPTPPPTPKPVKPVELTEEQKEEEKATQSIDLKGMIVKGSSLPMKEKETPKKKKKTTYEPIHRPDLFNGDTKSAGALGDKE